MHFFKAAVALACLADSVLADLTQLTLPTAGSTFTAGSNITVQVGMGDSSENIDVAVIVIGLAPCNGAACSPANETMGDILYQGPYTPQLPYFYENYTVTVPQDFPTGEASLNVNNLFMIGDAYVPIVDYVSEDVTIVA